MENPQRVNVGVNSEIVTAVPETKALAIIIKAEIIAEDVCTRNEKRYFAADMSDMQAGDAKRYFPNFDLLSCISDIEQNITEVMIRNIGEIYFAKTAASLMSLNIVPNISTIEEMIGIMLLLLKCDLISRSFSRISVFIMNYTPCLS